MEIRLPSATSHVRDARSAVRAAAMRWALPAEVTDDLTLAASELVTNAVIHARSQVRVAVTRRGDCVRLEVEDDNPNHPEMVSREDDAPSGRGLHILRAISDSWGIDAEPPWGKTVWAELRTTPS